MRSIKFRQSAGRSSLISVIALFITLHAVAVDAESYTVRGRTNYRLTKMNGEILSIDNEFEIKVRDCAYELKYKSFSNTTLAGNVFRYDNGQLLSYSILSNQVPSDAGVPVDDSEVKVTAGSLEFGPMPVNNTFGAEVVWMAYASECYFDGRTSTNALHPHSGHFSGRYKRVEMPAQWEVFPNPPHLLKSLTYYSPGIASLGTNSEIFFHRLPKPLDKGRLESVFKVTATTNVNGLTFPSAFEYKAFSPLKSAQSSNDLECVLQIHGDLDAVSVSPVTFSPIPKAMQVVGDHRTADPGVLLLITNGVLPDMDSAQVAMARARGWKNVTAIAQFQAAQKQRLRVIIGVAVAAVSLLLVVLFWGSRSRDAG